MREAIDDHERGVIEVELATERRWWSLVERAAVTAPGGQAVWLGSPPARPLPAGFAWLVLDASEAVRLPDDRFRLVVARAGTGPLERTLAEGGLIVGPPTPTSRLRLLALDETDEPPLAISRREA